MIAQTTFLDAIQKIPGDTPGEKYHKISQLVSSAVKNGQSISMLIESQQLHSLLGPYCEVEAARVLKNHQMVAEALKSEDSLVIGKALSIKSFFDGSDREVTNPDYLFKHLIPHVTLNTRLKIIKNLSSHLSKAPHLAEHFFTMVHTLYGIEQAMPLLIACSQEFTYSTVIEKNIVLSRRVVKCMYRKNPHLVIRYLKAVRRNELLNTRNNLKLRLADYSDFIVKFIKIDMESFVEIVESYENNNLGLQFSNNLAGIFMKKGKNYLLDKPMLYMQILPLKAIDVSTMCAIFPKLLPEKCESFEADELLDYLEYYPKEGKWELLEKSYANCYGRKLLDNFNIITPKLMLLLPVEERIRIAKILMTKNSENQSSHYRLTWRCYVTANEIIPIIKKDISKASQIENRCDLIGQIIYCCRVNDDDCMFLDFLKYFNDRHKNENVEMYIHFLRMLNEIYEADLYSLSTEHWDVINGIIRRMYVKGYIDVPNYSVLIYIFRVLEASTHHKLLHNLTIEKNIELLAHRNLQYYDRKWNILVNHPEYEEKCLSYFIDYVLQKIEDPSPSNKSWHELKKDFVSEILDAIYDYNSRHVKNKKDLPDNQQKKNISVSNYPRLMKIVIDFLNNKEYEGSYVTLKIIKLLELNDGEVFKTNFPNLKNIMADVHSGEALSLLKRKPESILENWKLYLSSCENWSFSRNVIRFIKTVRWHNSIPVKWREECEKSLTDHRFYLGVLGILLDGPSFVQIVSPFMPKQKTLQTDGENARTDYFITSIVPSVCNLVNPPAPLSLISHFFEGDYLSDGLKTAKNLCRRTAVSKVIPFLTSLVSQRVSVKKHAIRFYYMVATIDNSCKLLLSQWQTEKHHSIREILFHKILDLFLKNPSSETFILLKNCINSFNLDDNPKLTLLTNFNSVPNQYLAEYLSNLFDAIEKLKDNGLSLKTAVHSIGSLLNSMDSSVCDILSEPYCMEIIRKYLFDDHKWISRPTLDLALDSFILSSKQNTEHRLIYFVEMLSEKIRSNWDHPCAQKLHYYPVNKVFYKFVERFCNSYTKEKIDLKLVELILEIFKTTLDPKMDMRTYLYLIYSKELLLSTSVRDFGLRISCEIKRLIKVFSELLMHFMSETMEKFLGSSLFHNLFVDVPNKTVAFSFINGLLEDKNVHNYYMAAHLLHKFNCNGQEYKDLVCVLLNCEHPLITSLVRQKINSITENCNCTSN